jgi:glycosyltransferase involved in cell wall biosynthesis
MELADLTVIVPTKNEAHNIGRLLASVPPAVHLIVVDDSEDGTPTRAAELRPRQTTVIRTSGNVSWARHVGARAARTSWLLFTDADVMFAPGYFERLRAIRDCDLVYGPKLSRDEFVHHYRMFASGQKLLGRAGIIAATGSNLAVKRLAWQAVGGFDTKLSCNEDSEFAWRLARSGYAARYCSDLVVYAFDHRRLYKGTTRKTVHSVVRCALMYTNLMPKRWRYQDWGYWSSTN